MDRRADDGQPVTLSTQLTAAALELQHSYQQFVTDAAANGWAQSDIDSIWQSACQAYETLLSQAAELERTEADHVLH